MWGYLFKPFQLIGKVVSYVWQMMTPASNAQAKPLLDKPSDAKKTSAQSKEQTTQMLMVLDRLKRERAVQSTVQESSLSPMGSTSTLRYRGQPQKDLACVSSVIVNPQVDSLASQYVEEIPLPKKAIIKQLPNIKPLLDFNTHLKPLMRFYHGLLNPSVNEKDFISQAYVEEQTYLDLPIDHSQFYGHQDWGCISTPDGSVCGVVLGGGSTGHAGSVNIKDAYYRALAECILKNHQPKQIRVASVINHSNAHFTSSVATVSISPTLIEETQLRLAEQGLLDGDPSVEELMTSIALVYGIDPSESVKLAGAINIDIDHYDSFNPGSPKGPYFKQYLKSLDLLLIENPIAAEQINARLCAKQRSNTCGDQSMWNIFHAGILGVDVGSPKYQLDSYYLRAHTYKVVHGLQEGHDYYDLSRYVQEHALRNAQVCTLASNGVGHKTKNVIL